jgi:hypothetical protein
MKKNTKPAAAKSPKAPKAKEVKCQAFEIGHRACRCGGEYCQPPLEK